MRRRTGLVEGKVVKVGAWARAPARAKGKGRVLEREVAGVVGMVIEAAERRDGLAEGKGGGWEEGPGACV